MILKNLHDKDDLLSTRFVCKKWADVAATLLFRRITLWQFPDGCLKFSNVAPRLAAFDYTPHIRHLIYKFMDPAINDATSRSLNRYLEERENEQNPVDDYLYALFRTERNFLTPHSGLSLEAALLTTTFYKLPNLKSLHIIELDHIWSAQEESPLSSPGEELEDDNPLSAFTRGHQVLYKLFASLSESETEIEALTISSSAYFISLLPNLVPWLHCFGTHSRPNRLLEEATAGVTQRLFRCIGG